MIVTIDGPAGAGKSSIARRLAEELGFAFLDTGAMYRAVAWAALQAGIDVTDPAQVESIARQLLLRLQGDRVFVGKTEITQEIRTPEVTEAIKFAANNGSVREILSRKQREIAREAAHLVSEGRDQGTAVFPDAECKIFLTASPEERARRRHAELERAGQRVTLPEVLASQNTRDAADAARAVGPLVRAEDAIEVCTDGMTPEQVLAALAKIVRGRLGT